MARKTYLDTMMEIRATEVARETLEAFQAINNESHSESINAGINEGTNAGINEGTNAGINGGANTGINGGANAGTNAGINEGANAGINEGTNAGTNGGINERAHGLTEELTEELTKELTHPRAKAGTRPGAKAGTGRGTIAVAHDLTKVFTEPRNIRVLTEDCRRVLNFIIDHNPLTIGYAELAAILSVSYPSLRKYTNKLTSMGYITKRRICEGAFQGTCFMADENMCGAFKKFMVENGRAEERKPGRAEERKPGRAEERKPGLTKELTKGVAGLLKEVVVEETPTTELSGKLRSLFGTSYSDFGLFWPTLLEHGFGPANLQSVISKRFENGMCLDDQGTEVKALKTGLTHANAALETNGDIRDSKGDLVDVPSWVFKVMVRTGSYPKPKGWEDPAIVALREAAAAETEQRALEAKVEKQRADGELKAGFEEFWANVPEEELQACRDASPVKTDEAIKRLGWIRWKDRQRTRK